MLALRDSERGMGMLEIIVAVVLIMIVAASTASLTIQGLASTAGTERRQLAVAVANTAMTAVAAQPEQVDPDSGVSGLYNGRFSTPVNAAFTANSTAAGVPATYPGWDPTATASTVAEVPITQSVVLSGTTFSVSTLIGTCYQQLGAAGTTGTQTIQCQKISGYSSAPATPPSGYTPLIRIVVVVSWTAGRGCTSTPCRYSVSTLIDPHSDLTWLVNG
jgi:Tfp pilus assembly protein PilV